MPQMREKPTPSKGEMSGKGSDLQQLPQERTLSGSMQEQETSEGSIRA